MVTCRFITGAGQSEKRQGCLMDDPGYRLLCAPAGVCRVAFVVIGWRSLPLNKYGTCIPGGCHKPPASASYTPAIISLFAYIQMVKEQTHILSSVAVKILRVEDKSHVLVGGKGSV